MSLFDYIHEGSTIYRHSFDIIRREADLSVFNENEARVAVRIIHACGQVKIAQSIQFHPDFIQQAEQALQNGSAILCDSEMVAHGITKKRLPANNQIICTLNHPETPLIAQKIHNTRSAAAIHLWKDQIENAIIIIGNAPTALFHLMNLLENGKLAKPAAIIGIPVGFVGAAESKKALQQWSKIPYMTVHGRQGGSAMAVAALNAIAQKQEI